MRSQKSKDENPYCGICNCTIDKDAEYELCDECRIEMNPFLP